MGVCGPTRSNSFAKKQKIVRWPCSNVTWGIWKRMSTIRITTKKHSGIQHGDSRIMFFLWWFNSWCSSVFNLWFNMIRLSPVFNLTNWLSQNWEHFSPSSPPQIQIPSLMVWHKPKSKMDWTGRAWPARRFTLPQKENRRSKFFKEFGNTLTKQPKAASQSVSLNICRDLFVYTIYRSKSASSNDTGWKISGPNPWGVHSLPKCRWHWGKWSRTASGTPRTLGCPGRSTVATLLKTHQKTHLKTGAFWWVLRVA